MLTEMIQYPGNHPCCEAFRVDDRSGFERPHKKKKNNQTA